MILADDVYIIFLVLMEQSCYLKYSWVDFSDKELYKIHFRCSLIFLIFTIIFNILHFEENQKCFDSSYIHVNESNKCKKSLSVVQLGNQNSASRFNDTLQNKWRTLYCNVSLLLQFTVCVFQYIQSIYFLIHLNPYSCCSR